MQIRVAKAASDAAAATGAGIRVALLLPCFFGCFFCTADSSTSTKSSSSNGGAAAAAAVVVVVVLVVVAPTNNCSSHQKERMTYTRG